MPARVRIRAALCLALALANSGPAHAADPVHTTATPPPTAAPPAAPDPNADPCAPHAGRVAAWLEAQREIASRTVAVEALEAEPIAYQLTECPPASLPGECTVKRFDRERELERATASLHAAEARFADAEDSAREAGVPDRCLVDPDE